MCPQSDLYLVPWWCQGPGGYGVWTFHLGPPAPSEGLCPVGQSIEPGKGAHVRRDMAPCGALRGFSNSFALHETQELSQTLGQGGESPGTTEVEVPSYLVCWVCS